MKLIQTMATLLVLCITLLAQEPAAVSPGTVGGQAGYEDPISRSP